MCIGPVVRATKIMSDAKEDMGITKSARGLSIVICQL